MNMISVWLKERWTKEMWHFRCVIFLQKSIPLKDEEKPENNTKEMTIFWCFLHNVCKLMQFKCCAIYGLSYVIHTNGNTCSVMWHCRKQLCFPLLWKFQFSYMRKFFCYRFNPSLHFYFFVRCFSFCTPTSWMPGRGGYEYFPSHYDDWSIKHNNIMEVWSMQF